MKKYILFIALPLAIFIALNCLPDPAIRRIMNPICHPGYGECLRCHRTWDVVHGHQTPYMDCTWIVTASTNNTFAHVDGVANDGKPHEVTVTNGECCFPLCEQCWKSLTPKERLSYYRELLNDYERNGDRTESAWPRMKQAVMEGK